MGLTGVIVIARADGTTADVPVVLAHDCGAEGRVFETLVPVELGRGDVLQSGPQLRAGDELRWTATGWRA
jgi:hypothetical protein